MGGWAPGRFVVFGAGAIGGVIGARLHQSGRDVVLIARGAQLDAIRRSGLRIQDPAGEATLRIEAVARPADAGIGPEDVVILAMKSHHTASALVDLRAAVPREVPVACAQNGVANERMALRLFPNVYAIAVLCPTGYLEPGVVQAYAAPTTGILDVGRYPHGRDDLADTLVLAFRAAGFDAEAKPDIMRWKYSKLLDNLGNAVEGVCGPPARRGPIGKRAREEGVACLRAAGIEFAESRDRARTEAIRPRAIAGRERPGGSTWQSLARAAGSVETDYLNGEVVLLGRSHGVPTPVNELLQQLAHEAMRDGRPPGLLSEQAFLERLGGADATQR
jgi:2-dehydropantoate 2-reductase